MAKYITKTQMEELEDACTFGIGGRISCSRNTPESKPAHTRRTTTTTKTVISLRTVMKPISTVCLRAQAWRCDMAADEYIRRADALHALYEDYAYPAMDIIKGVPAADVVEVVRCKDCKMWEKQNVFEHRDTGRMRRGGCCRCSRFTRYEDDFCSSGEYQTNTAENQPTPSGKKVSLFDLNEVQESMEGNINE